MNLKAIAAIGLVAVGVGAVGVSVAGLGSSTSSAVTYRTSTATTGTVQQTAAASGNLAAATIYDLAFGTTPVATSGTAATSSAAGSATGASSSATSSSSSSSTGTSAGSGAVSVTVVWPVTEVKVVVGDLVKQGDVLATADDSTARLAVRAAEANLDSARAQRRTDLAGGTATSRAQAKDQVSSAQRQLTQARVSYANTVAQNALSLRRARQSLADARAQYAADKKAGAPAQTLQQDKAAITQASQSLESAKLQVSGGNSQAASQITSAKASLASAKRSYNTATTAADDAVIVGDDVAIANAKTALDDANDALAAATLTAPIDGRVTVVNAIVGQESSGTAIQLQSTRLALSVSVTEDDILNLKVGQAASVAISATGGTAKGIVTSVDPVATSSGTSTVVSYKVVVTLDDLTPAASSTTGTGATATTTAATSPAPSATTTTTPLPGMSAEITIVIAQADNAVSVPAIALSGTTGSYTVRVLNADGTVESRPVQVGLVTSDLAQITSGVNDGETVVTGTSADRTTTSSSATNRGSGGFGGIGGTGGFQPPAGGFPGGQP